MAGFEQNQQDAFNQRNGAEILKQTLAEADRLTASIGAAEVEAEKELAELKLTNLTTLQKERLKKLDELLALEEAGIQKLANARLTLSDKQFEARKKQIQEEFQLAQEAIEKLYKAENKRVKKSEASEGAESLQTAKTETAATSDKSTFSELTDLIGSIDKTLSSLHDTMVGYVRANPKGSTSNSGPSIVEDIKASTEGSHSGSKATGENISANVGKKEQGAVATPKKEERQYAYGNVDLLDTVDLGQYSPEAVFTAFETLQASMSEDLERVLKQATAFNVDEKGNKTFTASQFSTDLAGDLLLNIKKAEAAEKAFQEYKQNAETEDLNNQLIFEAQLQKRKEELASIDLQQIKERAAVEADIAFNRAHRDEILAQELQAKRLGYLKEYQEYQKKAGKYAVSQEDFEKNKARKDNKAAKNEATSGITEAIQSGQFSKLFSADNKEAVSKYMGQRTAELENSYMANFDKKNPEATEKERAEAKKKAESNAKLIAGFELVANAARDLAQTLNAQTDKIGAKQAPIDTRLQGSRTNDTILGSYWKQLARDMNKIGAVNPYFTQEDFANNIETLVNKGISFDIKQRAFLMTIQEKIANTFDVADGTLLRLIRIQQQDTTAGRLGMESALNSFLNSMYETSEYLTDVASSVRSSLGELQALMEGAAGTELEFQVQKWMGSLYSVGMSQDAVQSIAQTFGQIASGDVSGLTGSGTGNLLIMAANEAGKSIADILQDGLDAKETNELMQAMVNYLAEIAETSSDSRVVQQQLANVYGMKASDLRAATNLASSIKDVSNQDLTYGGMLGQLNKMANSMMLRTSTGEMLSNIWGNVQYTMATQMSNDPVLYLLPRMATLLEDYAGGIDLPFLNVMGFGVDLNTSVAQLMNVAAMSGSILGALGPMMSGLASAASGSIMLNLAGINTSGKAPVIARGSAQPLQHLGGSSISESGYIGNSSGEDVKNATLQDAEDSKKKQMVEAKDEESSDDIVIRAQQAAVDIYNLLEEVAHGSQSLRVRLVSGNGLSASGSETPVMNNTSNNMSTDNGNWVLSF